MNLSKVLNAVEALSSLSVMDGVMVDVARVDGPAPATARIGDVTLSVGVANDLVEPANDHELRTQVDFKRALVKRGERRDRREGRALSF